MLNICGVRKNAGEWLVQSTVYSLQSAVKLPIAD